VCWRRRTPDTTSATLTPPGGILSGPIDGPERTAAQYPHREATPGVRVLHRASGFTGTLVALDGDEIVLRGHTGLERRYTNLPGTFAVDGTPTHLVPVRAPADDGPRVADGRRTASGSRAVVGAPARVARGSRIWVEGVHDAELVEKVWGDDLRVEGIVVERLDGADHLEDEVRAFAPGPGQRLGVLLDHLVAGSKEARLAAAVRHPHVLVAGTPYVDVWEAVRPRAVGIEAWPVIPKGQDWKTGICRAVGVEDPRVMWRRILDSVHDWKQLEQPFVAAVEQLIDFVTAPGDA
jgi:Protein of unknown function (DUF3097)